MSYFAAVVGYLVVVGAVAVWRWHEVPTDEDFTVAGRQMPARLLMPTLFVTWISAGTLFGAAGLAYRVEFPALWMAAGGWIGIAALIALAPRIRAAGADTVPEILAVHFGRTAQLVATMALVVAYVTIVAYQFRGGGRLLQLAIGMDPRIGAAIFAAFCIAYAALAGLRSIAWTDLVHAVAIALGVSVTAWYLAGGVISADGSVASSHAHRMVLFGPLSPIAALGLLVPTLVLVVSEASVYQKAAAARDPRAFRRSLAGWLVATVVIEFLLVTIAIEGRHLVAGLTHEQSEEVIVRMATGALPMAVSIVLLWAATAILVSTATSIMLAAATSLIREMTHARRDAVSVTSLRLAVIAIALTAYVIGSLYPRALTLGLWTYGMYAASVGPALMAALLWPHIARQAVLASMAVGVAATLIWEIAGLTTGGYPLGMDALLPAVLASSATLIAINAIADRQS
jgi:Na+/proline symporter